MIWIPLKPQLDQEAKAKAQEVEVKSRHLAFFAQDAEVAQDAAVAQEACLVAQEVEAFSAHLSRGVEALLAPVAPSEPASFFAITDCFRICARTYFCLLQIRLAMFFLESLM